MANSTLLTLLTSISSGKKYQIKMSQANIIKVLKKAKKPLLAKDIAKKIDTTASTAASNLSKLIKQRAVIRTYLPIKRIKKNSVAKYPHYIINPKW